MAVTLTTSGRIYDSVAGIGALVPQGGSTWTNTGGVVECTNAGTFRPGLMLGGGADFDMTVRSESLVQADIHFPAANEDPGDNGAIYARFSSNDCYIGHSYLESNTQVTVDLLEHTQPAGGGAGLIGATKYVPVASLPRYLTFKLWVKSNFQEYVCVDDTNAVISDNRAPGVVAENGVSGLDGETGSKFRNVLCLTGNTISVKTGTDFYWRAGTLNTSAVTPDANGFRTLEAGFLPFPITADLEIVRVSDGVVVDTYTENLYGGDILEFDGTGSGGGGGGGGGGTGGGYVPPPAEPTVQKQGQRFTIYDTDDTTSVWTVGSDASVDLNAYLLPLQNFSESEIDLLRGSSALGQMQVRILDKRVTASDQQTGWLTARLADADGYSSLIGRRARFEQDLGAGYSALLDGTISDVQMDPDIVVYTITLRDIRERERKTRAFLKTSTSTVFPRGTFAGYGALPNGGWLLPPATPIRGTFTRLGGSTTFGSFKPAAFSQAAPVPAELAYTDAMKTAERKAWSSAGKQLIFPDVEVMWRPVGGPTWTVLSKMPVEAFVGSTRYGGDLFAPLTATLRVINGSKEAYETGEAVARVWMHATATAAVPANGEEVELLVRYVGVPTKHYPLHIEATAGELLADLYNGVYSDGYNPRIRYDATEVAKLTEKVRARITEPIDNLREWTEENIYKPLGAAPALNAAGAVSPVRYQLPTAGATIPALTDADAAPEAEWRHTASDAINLTEFVYIREFAVPAAHDPWNEFSAGDGIAERPVHVITRHETSIGLLGERELLIDPVTFRAIGGTEGQPVTGDVSDETGHQLAELATRRAIDRFVFGGQHYRVKTRRSTTGAWRPGDWIRCQLSWLPDYTTKKRGTDRLVQITGVKEIDAGWREIAFVDAGPSGQTAGTPAADPPVANSDGSVTVTITTVPAGTAVRVDYAITASSATAAPAENASAWTFAGRVTAPGTITTPPAPALHKVWTRIRGEGAALQPTAYTVLASVSTTDTPRVSGVRVEMNPATGVPVVYWTANSAAGGVRVFHEAHANGTDADPSTTYTDAAGTAGSLTLAAVSANQLLTAKVVPYATFSAGAVGGASGSGVTATSAAFRPEATSTERHTHPWGDLTDTPTTLADYGITDAASDAELAAHEADTLGVHGIADTSALIVEGDARLTDARTPTAHAASHASGGSDPLTPANIGAAAAAHNHNAADINAGILAPARGGTGVDASAAANGTLLIGNGTGFAAATLTAGSNVTITNGAGSVTIAAATVNGVFPFYKADGTADHISLNAAGELPFFRADGTQDNISTIT